MPTREHETDEYVAKSVRLSSGAERVDAITLEKVLQLTGERLQDQTPVAQMDDIVQVRRVYQSENEDGEEEEKQEILGWGHVVRSSEVLDEQQERVTQIARVENFHWGDPLFGHYYHTEAGSQVVFVEDDIVFNPEIDGIIRGNRSDHKDVDDAFTFVHPESVRTTAAATYQESAGRKWSLVNAVYTLCWQLNQLEDWITNPTRDDLQNAFEDPSGESGKQHDIRNTRIPLGTYLPQALEMLLTPLGYSFWLKTTIGPDDGDEEGAITTKIVFFKRNTGLKGTVQLQRIGQVRNQRDSDVSGYSAEYSYIDLANIVEGYSELLLAEGTFELVKGWSDEFDDVDLYTLDSPDTHREVGRKWVLNEAGDYIGLRDEITAPTDLTPILGADSIVRRRKFEHCISIDEFKQSLGTIVEWHNPDAEGGPAWERVKWGYSVLDTECGIQFEGKVPPEALWNLLQASPSTARIRITASIHGDIRRWGDATRRTTISPMNQDVILTLNLERKYPWRYIDDASEFTSFAANYGGFADEERDPASPGGTDISIQEFCENVRETSDLAQLSASVRLEGVDNVHAKIGNLIAEITDRNIVFQCRVAEDPDDAESEPIHPQIVGINYLLDGQQTTELLLETFRQEVPS